MNKNQNKLRMKNVKIYENVKIYVDHRDYNYTNCNVYITQIKPAGIPVPTIYKIFKWCLVLYKIAQFFNIIQWMYSKMSEDIPGKWFYITDINQN